MLKVDQKNDAVSITNGENCTIVILKRGAVLNKIELSGIDLIVGYDNLNDFSAYRSAWLFPFPNRLNKGMYHFNGKEYQFPCNEPNGKNALHGFIHDKEFNIISITENADEIEIALVYAYDGALSFYPFPFEFNVTYKIYSDSIDISVTIENKGNEEMIFGLGWHPYFKLDEALGHISLKMPVSQKIEIDENMIPSGEKSDFNDFTSDNCKIGETEFDTGFLIGAKKYTVDLASKKISLSLEMGDDWRYFQVFIPNERDCIALEPMTSNIDAFNNHEGLHFLKPQMVYNNKLIVKFATLQ
jgi:aldose 1-epimerase